MKKNMVLSVLSIVLAVSMLTMTGCGGGGGGAADPVAGTYTCVSQKFAVDGSGSETPDYTLVLESGGKGKSKRNGTEYELTWELSGTTFKMSEKFLGMTNDYSGTLSDNTITVYNGDPKAPLTYEYVFVKDGTGGASSADMSALANLLGGSTNTGNTEGGDTAAPVSEGSVTEYECVGAEMYEMQMAVEDVVDGGAAIRLASDGTAVFRYGTDEHQMRWTQNGESFHIEDDYNEMDGTLKDGVLVLHEIFKSSMTMTFIDRNVADESTVAALTGPKLDLEMIGKYEGDWFGELVFQDGTGGYEQWIGTETLVMARFSFDEEGKLTPWLFAAVSDLNNNFKNVTGEIEEILNEAFLYFDFFYAQMDTDNVYVGFDGDVMVMYPTFDRADGKGSFQARIAMKRLHEEWTDEEAEMYPFAPPLVAETLAYDNVEDLASAFDLPYPTPVPPVTHIAEGGAGTPSGGTQNAGAGQQGGGTDFASAGPAGNAVMDYENKGVIFFNYDDSVFTFRNSVFDGLETPYEDGNVRITFHAEYADGLEARHKWLDDYSDQPEYRSEETTIAGLPARVVHLIDSTMFNDPYMYVLIDLRGTQEKYEDIFITVKGNTFEDIDADRVYAIINSIRFEP